MPVASNQLTLSQAKELIKKSKGKPRAKAKRKKKNKKSTEIPAKIWLLHGIVPPKKEHHIMPPGLRKGRKKLVPWRIDFAFPAVKVAVEIEGGVFSRGRHVRPQGFLDDMEKYNHICGELGWRILRYAPQTIDFPQIKRVLKEVTNAGSHTDRSV